MKEMKQYKHGRFDFPLRLKSETILENSAWDFWNLGIQKRPQ